MSGVKPPRVIAGSARRILLKVPRSARPMMDRIKQSVFDTISSRVPEAKVLDLFAGSGSMGIEALSRGADSALFVENDREAAEAIKANLQTTRLTTNGRVIRSHAVTFLKGHPERFDLIFVDSPFPSAGEFKYELLREHMHPDSIAVVRTPSPPDLAASGLHLLAQDSFGKSVVSYLSLP